MSRGLYEAMVEFQEEKYDETQAFEIALMESSGF